MIYPLNLHHLAEYVNTEMVHLYIQYTFVILFLFAIKLHFYHSLYCLKIMKAIRRSRSINKFVLF